MLQYPLASVCCSQPLDQGKEARVVQTNRFEEERARQNDLVLDDAPLPLRRLFAVDQSAYEKGALSRKTKELMGLVASLALRCDDCVTYHLVEATRAGAFKEEIEEALMIAAVVGGSITIPHLRRAHEVLEEVGIPVAKHPAAKTDETC